MRLNPQVGSKFISRPAGKDQLLPFAVLRVDHDGVLVITDKHSVVMLIPPEDWDRYVCDQTIAAHTDKTLEQIRQNDL